MDLFEYFVLGFYDFFGVNFLEFLNIFAPGCMLVVLVTWIITSTQSKKNEYEIEIPTKYTDRKAVYIQYRQHQWMVIVIYAEIFIFLIWSIANLLGGLSQTTQQCTGDCSEHVIAIFVPFFLKLIVILASLIVTMKYDQKKEAEHFLAE